MARSLPVVVLLALALAAPAAGQSVVPTAPEIGEALTAAGGPIKDGSRRVGTIELTKIGDDVEAVARFTRRPPGRRASLCLTIGGDKQCTKRVAKAGLKLTLKATADTGDVLRSTVRSGTARGSVEL